MKNQHEISVLAEYFGCIEGKLHRLKRHGQRAAPGEVLGKLTDRGYRVVDFRGVSYRVHRLLFALHRGAWPDPLTEIDHIDGDRQNNCLANLRPLTRRGNAQNRSSRAGSSSPYLGVTWRKSESKWQAAIGVDGKSIYLGCYKTQEEAYAAYLAAKAEHHHDQPVPRQ